MKKERGKVITLSITLILLGVLICLLFRPMFNALKFGLDLQGGFEILYQVEPLDGSEMTDEQLTATYKSMQRRIDSLGVLEPEITLESPDKIRVQLAGVTNQEEAREVLSTVASLSFRDADDNLLMTGDVLNSGGARVTTDSEGRPAISLSVKDKDTFYEVTNRVKDYENNIIVIWLDYDETTDSYANSQLTCGTSEDSHCLSAATVSQGFASDVIIQGNFTTDEAQDLVDLINSGSLPTKLTEISSQTVGASFGDNTLNTMLVAGIVGVVLIVAMLIAIYHFAGFISAIAILLYTILVFALFWLIGGVLTLPGIAALIVGIGMAVDSNVLMFARIKEELRKGRSLESAFKTGSKLSFNTILDSNLTTLLVAIIMFIFGESSVKGFATMLIINIIVTMLTMVAITRGLLKLFIKTGYFNNKTKLFINEKKTTLEEVQKVKPHNYLKYSKYFIGLSLIIVIVGVIFFSTKGFHLGIDYQGGSEITLNTEANITNEEIESDLEELSLTEVETKTTNNGLSIRIEDILQEDSIDTVQNYFADKYEADVDIQVISNVVKQDLIKNAVLAILISFVGIILYVSIRFAFGFAISSILCLVHDAFIMIAMMAILQIEIDSMFIAAVLAIIGYSINNTIVVFDRIRENRKNKQLEKMKDNELKDLINLSIHQTIVRSIYTSITTIIPVVTLMILGSHEILGFDVALLIGLIAGTYSSIFIAGFLWYLFTKRQLGKDGSKKVVRKEVQERTIKGIND